MRPPGVIDSGAAYAVRPCASTAVPARNLLMIAIALALFRTVIDKVHPDGEH